MIYRLSCLIPSCDCCMGISSKGRAEGFNTFPLTNKGCRFKVSGRLESRDGETRLKKEEKNLKDKKYTNSRSLNRAVRPEQKRFC
ncbi:hypothetical protein J6590_011549 [Homalodisca vitripennis]|nr:hypothetical protein J6590_011549 [Homalodisca vitripennis]